MDVLRELLVVVLVGMVLESAGLDLSQEGVCNLPVVSTQRVTYICRKRSPDNVYTRAKCTRIKKNRTYKPSCCAGWETKEHEDKCVPACKFGCTDGKCVAPDVCVCELPRTLVGHGCVEPTCDPPCSSATCVGINSCRCVDGYLFHNATHCVPSCTEPCVNGVCSAPDTCTCLTGYVNESATECVPKCEPECSNARCLAPGVCDCNDGYQRGNETHCEPICDICTNGQCVAPGECICNHGYTKIGMFCIPVCNPECINGICTAPNTCSCNPGYGLNTTNTSHCLPICKPECVNASCSSPNKCSCHFGYEPKDSFTSSTCKPICDSCENGECVSPNNCVCNKGYEMVDGKCAPVCLEPCQHGYCSEPNVCTCHRGFKLSSLNQFLCEPVCTPQCVRHAMCVSPDECKCLPGYEFTNHACKPKCTSCDNGVCVRSNDCQCNIGYVMVKDRCSPRCSDICVNGVCSGPEQCDCNAGYMRNHTNPHVCYKPCEGPCENGNCMDGVCICDSGYKYNDDNTNCLALDSIPCDDCDGRCDNSSICLCADKTQACYILNNSEPVTTTTGLAGLELSWILGGALSLLIIVLLVAIMHRMWTQNKRAHKDLDEKATRTSESVVHYTVPGSLLSRPASEAAEAQEDYYEVVADDEEQRALNEQLLDSRIIVEDERL